MNIAVFARSHLGNVRGGMEYQVHDLLTGLTERGHAVDLVTTPGDAIASAYEIHRAPRGRAGSLSREYGEYARVLASRLATREDSIVLGVSTGATPVIDMFAGGKVPVVVQCHGTGLMEIASQAKVGNPRSMAAAAFLATQVPKEVRYLSLASALVAVSERVRFSLRRFPYRAGALPVCHVITNGIAEDRFAFKSRDRIEVRRFLGLSQDVLVLLFAGRLTRQKGWDEALRIFRGVKRRRPCALVIVGDGEDRREVEAAAAGVEGVRWQREVGRDEVGKFMTAADILLFPTKRSEGLPLVVLEAAASGLPVAAPIGVLESAGLSGIPLSGEAQSDVMAIASLQPATGRQSYLPASARKEASVNRYESLLLEVLGA